MVTDLAHGRPAEQSIRAALLGIHLAERIGAAAPTRRDALYVTLLRSLGCTATSHEYARWFGGDDIAVRREGDVIDAAHLSEGARFVWRVAAPRPPSQRIPIVVRGMTRGPHLAAEAARADCETARQLGTRLGFPRSVTDALYQGFERWDGSGHPQGLGRDAIALPARIAAAASVAVMFEESLGRDDAGSILRRWSGRSLDPELVEGIVGIWGEPGAFDAADPLTRLLEAEPVPTQHAGESRLDDVAAAFAVVADLKSTHLHGHSRGVAALAERAASLRGEDPTTVRRAALLHDLGRAAVPTGIWERPGRLTTAEWELVRLHAYHGERILGRSSALAGVARIVGSHHERSDGSGYHRGTGAGEQSSSARLLAAADVYAALTEARPHRPAFSSDAAAHTIRGMPLDPESVECVLEAAGHVRQRVRGRPSGLTEREVEVLRLIVRGMSIAQAGRALFISSSTVHTHLAHVYEKTGVSTRAGAAVFAMEHDLLDL